MYLMWELCANLSVYKEQKLFDTMKRKLVASDIELLTPTWSKTKNKCLLHLHKKNLKNKVRDIKLLNKQCTRQIGDDIWSVNDHQILMLSCLLENGNWGNILRSVPNKTARGTWDYLKKQMNYIIDDIIDKEVFVYNDIGYFNTLVLVSIIMDELKTLDKSNVMQLDDKITEQDYLQHLSLISKSRGIDITWTKEMLKDKFSDLLDKVQSSLSPCRSSYEDTINIMRTPLH